MSDNKYSKDQIFTKLVDILVNDFELQKENIQLDTRLYEDLEFDSIDAVDLAVRLQQFTDKRISPEEFKQIRTISDIVETVYKLVS